MLDLAPGRRSRAWRVALLVAACCGVADVAAAASGRVFGRVTDKSTGKPVPQCRVMLYGEGSPRRSYATTRADGAFEFKGVAMGKCRISVRRSGYVEAQGQDGVWAAQFELTAAKPAYRADIVLLRGCTISGMLKGLDEETSQYYCVFAYPVDAKGSLSRSYGRRYVRVDVAGRYTLAGLPSGRYIIAAKAPFWQDVPYGVDRLIAYYGGALTPDKAKVLDLKAPQSLTDIDLRLPTDGGLTLRGTVVDAESGLPVPRCRVDVIHREVTLHHLQTSTQPDGAFELNVLGPGPYQVVADAREDGFARLSKWVDFKAGDAPKTVDFQLEMGVSMSGRIVSDTGAEVPKAYRVNGYVSPPADKVGRKTNRYVYSRDLTSIQEGELRERIRFLRGDGTFSVDGLPPGRLTLAVSNLPNGYYLKQIVHPDFSLTRTTPEFLPGQDVGGVRIIVSNQYGQIRGKIVYELNGRIAAVSRRVRLRTYFWGTKRYSTSSTVHSQADGTFLIKRVPAGKHKLVLFVGPSYASQNPGPVTVEGGKATDVGTIKVTYSAQVLKRMKARRKKRAKPR